MLLVMVDGAREVAQAVIAVPQVAECIALALAVSDFAGDGEMSAGDGRWRGEVAQAVIAVPQVAERIALALAVSDFAGDSEMLLVIVDGAGKSPRL